MIHCLPLLHVSRLDPQCRVTWVRKAATTLVLPGTA